MIPIILKRLNEIIGLIFKKKATVRFANVSTYYNGAFKEIKE